MGVYNKMVHRPLPSQSPIYESGSVGFHSIFQVDTSNFLRQSSSTSKIYEPKDDQILSFSGHEPLFNRSRTNHTINDLNSLTHIERTRAQDELIPFMKDQDVTKTLKRKATSEIDDHLDLDLSLKLNSRVDIAEKNHDDEVDSNLSLSLYSQSSSSNNLIRRSRLKEEEHCNKEESRRERASTLDLTI